jgi:hypothetical protein
VNTTTLYAAPVVKDLKAKYTATSYQIVQFTSQNQIYVLDTRQTSNAWQRWSNDEMSKLTFAAWAGETVSPIPSGNNQNGATTISPNGQPSQQPQVGTQANPTTNASSKFREWMVLIAVAVIVLLK